MSENQTLPPITLMLWDYQVALLLKALIKLEPANEDEANDCKQLQEILEAVLL